MECVVSVLIDGTLSGMVRQHSWSTMGSLVEVVALMEFWGVLHTHGVPRGIRCTERAAPAGLWVNDVDG